MFVQNVNFNCINDLGKQDQFDYISSRRKKKFQYDDYVINAKLIDENCWDMVLNNLNKLPSLKEIRLKKYDCELVKSLSMKNYFSNVHLLNNSNISKVKVDVGAYTSTINVFFRLLRNPNLKLFCFKADCLTYEDITIFLQELEHSKIEKLSFKNLVNSKNLFRFMGKIEQHSTLKYIKLDTKEYKKVLRYYK